MSIDRARELRHNPTAPERKLWAILHTFRDRGYHFRRQHPIGPYYADFACIHGKLVIEADGETHASAAELDYDKVRDDYLRSRGFRVLRFWNNEITENAEGVFTVIEQALANVPPLPPTPAPSPSEGGGRPPRQRKKRTGLKNLAARAGNSADVSLPLAGRGQGWGSGSHQRPRCPSARTSGQGRPRLPLPRNEHRLQQRQ